MPNDDWRFQSFKDTNGAYNRTLAVDTPQSRAQFSSDNATAASRAASPSPSGTNWNAAFKGNQPASPGGTNWNAAFRNNNPASPSGTNWAKAFPSPAPLIPVGAPATPSPAASGLSQFADKSRFSLGSDLGTPAASTPASDFYRDRFASMDITPRDRQMYGAGDEFGFNHY